MFCRRDKYCLHKIGWNENLVESAEQCGNQLLEGQDEVDLCLTSEGQCYVGFCPPET